MRIRHAVTHASPSSKVKDGLEWAAPLEQIIQFCKILYVQTKESKPFGTFVSLQAIETPLFETNVIIVVKIIDTNNLMTFL